MQNKKLVILIIAGVILAILVSSGVYFRQRISAFLFPKSNLTSPLNDKNQQKQQFKFDLAEWRDPAGFSFMYPKELKVNNHPEDEENYAFLELINEDKKGKIIIYCRDSEYADLDDWLAKDELVKDQNSLDTKIASMSAKKVALANAREITAFTDFEGVLYLIDSQTEGEDYWRQATKEIIASFKLIPLEGESEEEFYDWLEGFDTSGADTVEAVEVIE